MRHAAAFVAYGSIKGRKPATTPGDAGLTAELMVFSYSRIEYCARSRFANFGNASPAISFLKCAVC